MLEIQVILFMQVITSFSAAAVSMAPLKMLGPEFICNTPLFLVALSPCFPVEWRQWPPQALLLRSADVPCVLCVAHSWQVVQQLPACKHVIACRNTQHKGCRCHQDSSVLCHMSHNSYHSCFVSLTLHIARASAILKVKRACVSSNVLKMNFP